MKKQVFRIESDGFNGAWYPALVQSNRGLIIMLGDSSEDRMAKTGRQRILCLMAKQAASLSPLCLSASGVLEKDSGGIKGGRRQGRFTENV